MPFSNIFSALEPLLCFVILGFALLDVWRFFEQEPGWYVFGPSALLLFGKKILYALQTGNVMSIVSLTPEQILTSMHHSFPFDKAFHDSKLFREAKEECLAGRLFYPGTADEAIRYIVQVASLGIQVHGSRVEMRPVKPGVIELDRMMWNNRALHDLYYNGKFIRRVTCFLATEEKFIDPNIMTMRSILG
jgi:hypothetical protein